MPSGIRRRKLAKSGFNNNIKRRARKEKQKKYDFNNPVVEANWNPKLTIAQNYKNLGLAPNLQRATGGVEDKDNRSELLPTSKKTRTARIVRDEEGNTRIEYDSDPEDIDAPIKKAEAKTEVVRLLEQQAAQKKRSVHHQSVEQQKWLARLIAQHGDDYEAMQWDKKLNQFQHSAGELRRRIKKFRASQVGAEK